MRVCKAREEKLVRVFKVCQTLRAAKNTGEGTELRSEELNLVLAETFVNHAILSNHLIFGSSVYKSVKLGLLFLSCLPLMVFTRIILDDSREGVL